MKSKTTRPTRRACVGCCVGLFLLYIHINTRLTAGGIGDILPTGDLQTAIVNDLQIGYCLYDAGGTFWFTVTTDHTVESIQVECPSGQAFVLSDAETVAQLCYWRYTEDSEDNSWEMFGDGDYVITLEYSDQTGQSTVVSFTENDGTTGIAPPRKPSIIEPRRLNGAVVFPAPDTPVKFTWADIDPDTDRVEFRVQSLDSPSNGYVVQYTGDAPFLTPWAGPFIFSEGSWEAEIAAIRQRDSINADSIPYSCVRKATSSYRFEAYDAWDIEITYVHEFSFYKYEMWIAANTDRSVTGIQVRCPSGKTISITDSEIDGNIVEWEYAATSFSPLLSTFGEGNYVFTFSYSDGTIRSTTVPYAQADGITPIPDINMRPVIRLPVSLDGRTFCTPRLTFEWDNVDPGANRVVLDREWNDGDDENFNYSDTFILPYNRGPLDTRSDTFIFDAGRWEMDIEAFHSVMGKSPDGVRYLVGKKVCSDYEFRSAFCGMAVFGSR